MEQFKKFNEEVQKLAEILRHYEAGRVEARDYPRFEDMRNVSYATITLLNYIGDFMEDMFLYASSEAKKHGNLDSICLLNSPQDKTCVLTIRPNLSSARHLNPNKNSLLEETETYLSYLIRGIEEYEKYQKQRWIKLKP